MLIIFIMIKFTFLYDYSAFITGLGIVAVIYTCNLFNKPGSVTIACIVLIGIMINYSGPQSYAYAIGRSIDTAIGIIVAILINKYFNPPEEKE